MGSESDPEFEVEHILGNRKRKGCIEYLVKWKDYSSQHNTWEPITNLGDCHDTIAHYLEEKQKLKMKNVSGIVPTSFYSKQSPQKISNSPIKSSNLNINPQCSIASQMKSPVVSLCKLNKTCINQAERRKNRSSSKPKRARLSSLRSFNGKNEAKAPVRSKAKVPTRKVKPVRKVAEQRVFAIARRKDIVGEWLSANSTRVQDVVLDHDYLDVNVICAVGHRNTSESSEDSVKSKLGNQPLIPGGIQQKRFVYLSWNRDFVEIIFANTTRGNALTPRFLLEISKALDAVISSKCCTALLRSVGPIFSLGFDLQAVVDFLQSSRIREETARNLAEAIRNFVNKLIDFPKMLVAIVQGPCIGLACSMLSHFDAVYCSDRAVFWTPYAEMGVTPDCCSSVLFPEIMGKSIANNVLLNSSKLTAKQAKDRGFITDVFVHDNLQTSAIGIISKSASQAPEILQKSKFLIRSPHVTRLKHANYCEANQLMEVLSQPNAVNVIKQFLITHWYC